MHSQQRFEGASLEEVLEMAQSALDDEAVIVAANRLRTGGIAGFFAKERFEIIVAPSTPTSRPTQQVHATPKSLLDLADQVSDGEGSSVSDSSIVEPSHFASLLSKIEKDIALDLDEIDGLENSTGLDLRTSPTELGNALTYTRPVTSPTNPIITKPSPAVTMLSQLGLPQTLITATCNASSETESPTFGTSLLNSMQRLPHPPLLPRFAGAIVAVVGEISAALELARVTAIDLGTNPQEVLLASPSYKGREIPSARRITQTGVARELANRWRHQGHTQIIAVATSTNTAETLWASHLIGALQPSAVWAVVSANQKNEDVVAWSDRLGGIDALALTHLDETVSPAALLQTGIPIARLDGRPATPALWTALLTERLAA